MKYLLLILLTGCVAGLNSSQVVIEPIDAIRLCEGKVKTYNALSGRVTCKGK